MGAPEAVVVYLGLGSNSGDRLANLSQAQARLRQTLTIKRLSSIYETEPVGYQDQPRFLNAALSAMTTLGPFELLQFVKAIEKELGREPGPRDGPRPIDIDILFYGDLVLQTPQLVIPHPHLTERAFALVPLAEIGPQAVDPRSGKTAAELVREVEGLSGVQKREDVSSVYQAAL